MAIEVGTLLISMQADIARLSDDMGKARRTVDDAMGGIKRSADMARSALELIGVGVSVAAFSGLIKSSIDLGDRLGDLSKATDLTVRQLAGISLAAEQSGSDLSGIADSVSKLAENMGRDAEKFAKVGISAKNPLEAFRQLADVFNAIEDPQTRAAFAAEALGRSWKSSAPLLAEGGDKIGEMVARGEEMAGNIERVSALSDQFNDKLAEMKAGVGGLGSEIAEQLLPKLIDTADAVNGLSKSGSNFLPVADGVRVAFETFIVLGANVGYVFKQVGNEIGGISAQLAALAHGDFSGVANIGRMMKEDAAAARKEIDAFSERILAPAQIKEAIQHGAKRPASPSGVDGFIGGGGKKKSGAPFDPEADLQDAIEAAHTKNSRQAQIEAEREYAAAAKEAQSIIFDIDPIAKAGAEWERLLKLKEQGLLTDEQVATAYKKQYEEMSATSNRFAENLQRNLGDVLYNGLRGNFNNIGDAFMQMLQRMAADAAAANLMQWLFPGSGGGGGKGGGGWNGGGGSPGFGDFVMSLFNADGNAFASSGVQAFASGGAFTNGIFGSPTPFRFAAGGGFGLGVMGEAGPEAVMPLTRGPGGKLGVMAQGGGGKSVQLTYAPVIQIDSRTDQAQVQQLVSNAVQHGNSQLLDQLARSGVLAS